MDHYGYYARVHEKWEMNIAAKNPEIEPYGFELV